MAEKYKIGVNGWFFNKPYTGIGRYCLNVFCNLASQFPEINFIIPIPAPLPSEIDKEFRYLNNLKFELIPENLALKAINPGLSKSIWETFQLSKFFRNANVDLIHLPYPSLYKRIHKVPVVITVHDTIPWTDKEYSHRGVLSSLYNQRTLKLAKKADKLITVSNTSKSEILEISGFENKNPEAVYNATEFDEAPELTKSDEKILFTKFGIREDDSFLFYMGGFDKRKNVQRLVDVFRTGIAPFTNLKLVLGGGYVLGNSLFKDIYRGEGEITSRIIETGFLSNHDLIMLYRRAWAFFSMTTREGFGLPLLEALTLGCPALISDLSVHREIAGETPVFLNLNLPDSKIAESITSLYNSPRDYEILKKETLDFASLATQKYSWQSTAKQIGNIYISLIK